MKKPTSRFHRHRAALALAFALAGCGQTPAIIIDDSANFKNMRIRSWCRSHQVHPQTRGSGWICRAAAEWVQGETRADRARMSIGKGSIRLRP